MAEKRSYPLRLITGMSRAGTTSMTRALNLQRNVVSFGETGFWGIEEEIAGAQGIIDNECKERFLNIYKAMPYHPKHGDGSGSLPIPQEVLQNTLRIALNAVPEGQNTAALFRSWGEHIAEACGREFWVEKTPHHIRYIDRIIKFEADARIIIMLREPEAFLNSYKHQGHRKEERVKKVFNNIYHPAIASFVCSRYFKTAIYATKTYPDNVLVIRLEDLKNNPENTLSRVFSHLQIEADGGLKMPESNSSFPEKSFQGGLSGADKMWLYWMVNNKCKSFGYRLNKPKFDLFSFLGSLMDMAAWPIRNYKTITGNNSSIFGLIKRWLR